MPEKSEGSWNQEEEQGRKLFVGGLTYSTTDDMLKDYYSQWGELVDYIVMKDANTKRSRGFGFVTYADASCVDTAMNNRPHILDGKTVEAKRALPRDSKTGGSKPDAGITVKRLYVSGVREEHTEEMFREHFSQYGNIESIDIITDKATGKNRGFAYVTFDDYDAVDKCVLIKSHMIDRKRCDVKKALTKEEMNKTAQYSRDRGQRDFRSRGTGRGGGGGGGWNDGYGGGGYGGGDWNQGGGWNQGPGNWNQGGGNYYQQGYGGGGGGYDASVSQGYQGYNQQDYNQQGYPQQGYGQGDGSYQGWSNAAAGAGGWDAQGGGMMGGDGASGGWNQAPQGWQNSGANNWNQQGGAGRGGGPWRGGRT